MQAYRSEANHSRSFALQRTFSLPPFVLSPYQRSVTSAAWSALCWLVNLILKFPRGYSVFLQPEAQGIVEPVAVFSDLRCRDIKRATLFSESVSQCASYLVRMSQSVWESASHWDSEGMVNYIFATHLKPGRSEGCYNRRMDKVIHRGRFAPWNIFKSNKWCSILLATEPWDYGRWLVGWLVCVRVLVYQLQPVSFRWLINIQRFVGTIKF